MPWTADGRGFRHVDAFARDDDPLEPEVLAQTRERIGEGRGRFRVPGRAPWREREALGMLVHIERDDAVLAEQQRRGAENSRVRPLALGLHAEMGPGLFVGGL